MLSKISFVLLIISSFIFISQNSENSQARLPLIAGYTIPVDDSPILKHTSSVDSFEYNKLRLSQELERSKTISKKIVVQQKELINQAKTVDNLVDNIDCKDTLIIVQQETNGFKKFIYRIFHKD